MPLLPINGINLHYVHHPAVNPLKATQSPILLLAGMASDSTSWQPVVNPLRQHYELLIPDNRCCGRTTPSVINSSREAMVSDILGLLDALNIDRVNVVGHSMGGMLGWALACTAPDRVERLISAAALPQAIPARIALFRSLDAVRSSANEAQWFPLLYQFLFRPDFFNDPATVELTVAASMAYPFKQSIAAFSQQTCALESFLPALALDKLRCPVTLMTGSHDILTTPAMIEAFAASQPPVRTQMRTHIIQQAAHALHWEQTDDFVRVVREALNEA